MAREVAQGREPNLDKLTAVLQEAGKTVEDLAAFVECYQKRQAIVATLDALPALRAEEAELVSVLNAADAARDEALQQHAQTVTAPIVRLEVVRDTIRKTSDVEQVLVTMNPYPTLQQKYKELSATVHKLDAAVHQLQREKAPLPGRILDERERVRKDWNNKPIADDIHEQAARKLERELTSIDASLPGLERELSQAQSELAALEPELRKL
ncbi:MAG: hypothetical protein ACHRHE_15225 [Tepidisphaerales bacterium]